MAGRIRRFAEIALRNYRFGALLPAAFGRRRIYLSTGNQLAVLKPGAAKFESYLLGFATRFVTQESVVWDVGANMGIFSFAAATRAKRTIAFEPDLFNLDLLHRTRRANPDLALDIVPVAVSNEVGLAEFSVAARGRSANGLATAVQGTQTGGARERVTVVTVTADWLLDRFPAPDFIKCDAEGAELMILKGATKLLSEARPVMVVEMSNENAPGAAAIFAAADYVTMSSYEKVDPANVVTDLTDVWDVLAIPREKLSSMAGR